MKEIGIALLIFNALALAGCAGGNAIDRAVPQAAVANTAAPVQTPEDPAAFAETDPVFAGSGRATLTGVYPNINSEPRAATQQLTDAERDALVAQMQALADAHAKGTVSTAEYQRRLAALRDLAATHSSETIAKIEE
ncbi:MAG: hypothetical protein WAU86_15470 [Oricola sp.]